MFKLAFKNLQAKAADDQVQQALATVCLARVEPGPDGKLAVKMSTETLAADVPAALLSRFSPDEPVFAVVSANASRASRVLPVAEMAVQHASAEPAQ